MNGQLVGFRAEELSFHANVVAKIEQLEDREVFFRERVLTDVSLNLCAAVREDEKVGLAKAADRQDAPGRPRLNRVGFERFLGLLAVRCHQIRNRVGSFELMRIRINTKTRELVEVRSSLAKEVRFSLVLCHHSTIGNRQSAIGKSAVASLQSALSLWVSALS